MKTNKKVLAIFLVLVILAFGVMFLYPVLVTVLMSFSSLDNIASPMSQWTFALL